MSFKTIFVITVTVLVTIILMKNTDEVTFWLFGDTRVPKLAVLAVMFVLGFIVGVLVARPKKKALVEHSEEQSDMPKDQPSRLSDEDKEYLS